MKKRTLIWLFLLFGVFVLVAAFTLGFGASLFGVFLPFISNEQAIIIPPTQISTGTAIPPQPTGTSNPPAEPTETSNPPPQPPPQAGNQLANPCFDGPHNEDPLSWQQTEGWDVSSIKNPCGPNGTAARINDPSSHGESTSGQDEYIWQVVPGLGPNLLANVNCIHARGEVMDMNIYGGETEEGPWALVWKPFGLDSCVFRRWSQEVQSAETTIQREWAFYKVEFHARYVNEGAVKITSVYFSSR